ncbi:hypothetical protein ACIBKY_12780 [Nonomuraea sp. NPDC050394]|uniref:hypothetical protein n=1 Tax=Nonomuraea sp. NPDC050394 TaxID=3364363 RepID=UPI003790885A
MADHERREDELLVPAPRDDDQTPNDNAPNDNRNDDIENDNTRNDDYDTRAVYDTQPSSAPEETTGEHGADRSREPYTLPADDSVPPAPPYPTAVENTAAETTAAETTAVESTAVGTERGSGQEFGDGAYASGQIADRWRDVQAGFVDDPRAAVERADDLLEDLLRDVTRQAGEMRESWKSQQDTEQLRLALREYRSVMERLMAFSERK